MLSSLIGKISATDMDMVDEKTNLRFKNRGDFVAPEALIIHEQKLVPDERLLEACQIAYNCVLEIPDVHYIPQEILNKFTNFNVVVLDYDVSGGVITLGTIPEFKEVQGTIFSDQYVLHYKLLPIYYYVDLRTRQYGTPDFLAELPLRDKWDFIVQEAIDLGASDITVTNNARGAQVYYNARKTKVNSRRAINREDVNEIAKMLASSANSTMSDESAKPRFFGVDINKQNRGRVVINKTYYGRLITIRVLPNTVKNQSLEELNIDPNVATFIRETMLSTEKGLRLFIGETMSGKNTTILCALNELVKKDKYKIISLEQPVEILIDGIEQINAETDEEFAENADSLLRQNPDIVYFTEITERTASAIMKQANTAKAVFSTLHANSIADVLFRLQDITQMPIDRIILTMHSCVYQELVRDDKTDTVKPYNRCVYFDDSLKMRLFGKTIAEVRGVLQGVEQRWQ